MEEVDCIVVGAGVVGLAAARALALAGREVLVLEAAEAIGTETSSRNSEVIHAGIYYAPGSLMAKTCVEGRRRLYSYCADRGVTAVRCGKLIVATDDAEAERLAAIRARAETNGVEGLRLVGRSEALRMEPALDVVAAIVSPETGILDSHAYMLALQGDAEANGAVFAFRSPVERMRIAPGAVEVEAVGTRLRARTLVNAAGLHAPALAAAMEGFPADRVPRGYLAKGHYYLLSGHAPFSHLVYPVPVSGGLGVHLTIDLGGQAKFGPDVAWIDRIDYSFDESRRGLFEAAIRRYWPGLPDGALVPGYTGIRPKITPPGEPQRDFRVDGPAEHGVPGVVHLFGIESPGLTASLALADVVVAAAAGAPVPAHA
jgi:L-2-hydroxyglutarate oxidase LhgO